MTAHQNSPGVSNGHDLHEGEDMMQFPQKDFCAKFGEITAKNQADADKIINELFLRDASLRVSLPSGYSLCVPVAAAKMYDHGVPKVFEGDPEVTANDIQNSTERQNNGRKPDAEEMLNEATLNALKERPSLVVKQKEYCDLLMSKPIHEARDIGDIQAMQFACKRREYDRKPGAATNAHQNQAMAENIICRGVSSAI